MRSPSCGKSNIEPNGVLRKNLKPTLYLVAAGIVILAATLQRSGKEIAGHPSRGKSRAAAAGGSGQHRQQRSDPEEQRCRSSPACCPAIGNNRRPGPGHGECDSGAAGRPLPDTAQPGSRFNVRRARIALRNRMGMGSREGSNFLQHKQEAQQLAAKERELAYNARFASNLVYARTPESPAQQAAPAGPESAVDACLPAESEPPRPGRQQPGPGPDGGRPSVAGLGLGATVEQSPAPDKY